MKTETLLVEIGTEELPPKAIKLLGDTFHQQVVEQLTTEGFSFSASKAYYSPRRLAVMIEELSSTQPDQVVERSGPNISSAFDSEGNPTKAAIGFAQSCGVTIDELERVDSDKGPRLFFQSMVPGKSIDEVIPHIVNNALQVLPIPKPMRWGSGDTEFVRPIHWVVLMYGKDIVPCKIKNLSASNITYGHRFHAPSAIVLKHASSYAERLASAKVLAEFEIRKSRIELLLQEQAEKLDAVLDYDEGLLEEVTNLVEWPEAVVGQFSSDFLEIPHEALVATMQDAQRYFPLYSTSTHKLLANFITIANINSKNVETIRRGNERVIKPRFEDAAFFWQRDKARTLESRLEELAGILFEKQLGSILDKSQRVKSVAVLLADSLGLESQLPSRAALLCKCDLLTEMVTEFPKLQGIMGYYYARKDGEPIEVAEAIREHYQPTQSGSEIATSMTGKLIAISDRIDTLVGIFATGKKPSGVKDPYGLRRAALGIVRTSIEGNIDFKLPNLLTRAVELLPKNMNLVTIAKDVEIFIYERLRGYLSDSGFQIDTIDAVRSVRPESLFDFHRRVQAVHEFRKLPEAESLAAANKRIRNILKKADNEMLANVNSDLLSEGSERNLYNSLVEMEKTVAPNIQIHEYGEALASLAKLKLPIDSFFDDVMVMDDRDEIRSNRIALVTRISNQFTAIADISCLQN